jgi:hypothetical protein
MRKVGIIGSFVFLFNLSAFSQELRGEVDSSTLPSLKMHYQTEFDFDKPVNPKEWASVTNDLHASFGSTERSYFRTEVPVKTEEHTWNATGWKGEKLDAQILVWSPDTLEQVRFKINDLSNGKGKVIGSKNFSLNMIRYVLGNYPYGAKEAVCGNTPYKNGFLMPDRFEAFDRFDVPGKTIRPVWLTINVPSGTEAGTYRGEIEVICSKFTRKLHVQINVQDLTLPAPHEWKYRLDLWQNPWVVAWRNHVKPWSEEHKQLLKKHLQLYADAGGKYITTYAVHSPWADNSYMIEGGMIDWIKKRNGTWKFDYSIFDTYVELAMSLGIDKAITIYTAVPWGDRFRVKDEATGNYNYEIWPTDSKTYSDHWNIFLTDLRKHLEKKGWFEKTYIGINESEMKQTLAAIHVIKNHSKDWKITYAGNWHKELDGLLDDYSYLYGNEPNIEEQAQRSARGATTTFYVCCNPAKPNNFVFSPPVEGRWISWYSAARGYNGFLRWAYDAWPEDPDRDARFGSWPSGDTYIVYPGGISCVRFEKLREGIADFEKIRIIKELALKSSDKTVKELWQQFEQHLQVFVNEKDFNEEKITADVLKGNEMLDQLSDKLSGKVTNRRIL